MHVKVAQDGWKKRRERRGRNKRINYISKDRNKGTNRERERETDGQTEREREGVITQL